MMTANQDRTSTRIFELTKTSKLPNLSGMMLATVRALKEIGGSGTIQEIVDRVIEQEGISEEEQSWVMPNGRDRKLNYYLAWARTYLKRGNALENSTRGVWALTDTGDAIAAQSQTKKIYKQVNQEERERARQKRLKSASEKMQDGPAGITDESAYEDQELMSWEDELLSELLSIEPDAFERLAQRLLREAGFVKVEVRGKTGDGGIDGVGVLRVNLVSFQVYFQCKRWSTNSIRAKDIRDFRGALQGRADKGLFITTSNFTKQASEEATRDGAIAIDLIDGERLCNLLKEYNLGVKTETVEKTTVLRDWFKDI